MVNSNRKLPHKSMDSEFAEFLLDSHEEVIKKYSQYVVTAGHNDTLANHFSTLSTKLIESAILGYYFTDSPAADVLDLFSQAAQAVANYFRLRPTLRENHIQFEWRGTRCSVQGSSFRLLASDSSLLNTGLMTALVSGNEKELNFLAKLDSGVHVLDNTPDFTALRVMYLQALCRNDASQIIALKDRLATHIRPAQRLDAKLIQSSCKVFLSLPESDAIQLNELIANSLSAHRKLFNNDRRNRRMSIFGFISLEMLTAVVLASHRGTRVDIQDDYVSVDLIEKALDRHKGIL